MLRSFRNAFFAGLFTLLPLGVTAFVLTFLVDHVGDPASRLFFGQLPRSMRPNVAIAFAFDVLSIFLVVILVATIGYVSRYVIGRWIIGGTERIIGRLPFIRMLYNTSKQIVGTFSEGKRAVFQRAVLVEFPHPGMHSIGFITSTIEGEMAGKTRPRTVAVFIPTTPNPTSGFLVLVPRECCVELDLSIADAMKTIISGGAFVPSEPAEGAAKNTLSS
ncbi:MAG: DUF502 domain-containing protein [Puniceicoccales bacterium]|jgi:uncharacterized membrane protein|nr:DUF502 domain-containing protein [Puniceicoccales bacterium]